MFYGGGCRKILSRIPPTEFPVNTYTTNSQARPKVAADGSGNFVVAWDSLGQDGSIFGVFGQRYGSSGAPLGLEFRVNTYTTSSQARPSVAADGSGNTAPVGAGPHRGEPGLDTVVRRGRVQVAELGEDAVDAVGADREDKSLSPGESLFVTSEPALSIERIDAGAHDFEASLFHIVPLAGSWNPDPAQLAAVMPLAVLIEGELASGAGPAGCGPLNGGQRRKCPLRLPVGRGRLLP